ncbi:MAG: hypothetical protein ACE5HD_05825 [Acidobacteriota bacterium]
MRFYYIYKALAHPEYHGYVTPFTLEERLMQVKEAQRTLGSRIPWLCDGMSNDLKHAFGDASNGEFVIDSSGQVIRRRKWSDPEELRRDLEELIGPVDPRTRVGDLHLEAEPPPETVAHGVVPAVRAPGPMHPLRMEPVFRQATVPFYVKLRAEVDDPFLETNSGTLYLGFHLDPLYHVHWNNLAAPLEFTLKAPGTVEVIPGEGRAPKVKEPADADPREFLLKLHAGERDRPLALSVRYFACDDANTFCVPVTQEYTIHLQVDPDGGSAPGRRRGSAPRRRRDAGSPPRPVQPSEEPAQTGHHGGGRLRL